MSVPAVAISEDDPSAMAAIATASSGLSTLVQSVDGGATWSRLADSDGIGLDATSGLWIVPGNPDEVVTSWVDGAATDFPLHLNVSLPKTGTHTVKAGWFYGLTQMVFTSERWLASVHGVPPN